MKPITAFYVFFSLMIPSLFLSYGNYDIIHGTFFVCGLTRDDFTDLTPQQMKHYEEMYHDPQLFFLLGKTLCVEHTTPEEYTRVMAPPPKTKESPER